MRSALSLVAAGLVAAAAGQALAASPSTAGGPSASPMGSSATPPSGSAIPPSASSSAPAANAAASAGANTSATTAPLQIGEPVKDSTGATIGAIASLSNGANGQQMAVIKMGNDTFQVQSDRLGAANGAATINLTQAQIASMLHPPAGVPSSNR